MTRSVLKIKLFLTILALGFLCASIPIGAASKTNSEPTANQKDAEKAGLEDSNGGQVAIQLNQNEVDSIAEALPEGELRQMFKAKMASAQGKDIVSAAEEPVEGEEIAKLFFDSEKALSRVQEQIRAFFIKPTSTIDSREWTVVWQNLTHGKGLGYLLLTFFMVAVIIFSGLTMELLVRRFTEGLRRQILDAASLGSLQLLGRVFSRLLLNLLGLGTYMLTTFVLFALFYDEGDPGFYVVSMTIIVSQCR